MTQLEIVIQFAREYINNPKSRTSQQRILIRDVYKDLTGDVVSEHCGSCYIAALIQIVKLNKRKMATSNYVLKPGAILQAFGDASKIATNKNLTDELAEWYLKNVPGSSSKFSKLKAGVVIPPYTGITVLKSNIVQPEKIVNPQAEAERIAKEKADAEALEAERIAKEKADAEANALKVKRPGKRTSKKGK